MLEPMLEPILADPNELPPMRPLLRAACAGPEAASICAAQGGRQSVHSQQAAAC